MKMKKSDIPDLILDGCHGNIENVYSSQQQSSSSVEDDKESLLQSEDSAQNIFTIRICKAFQLNIFKPLVPLKLSLFLWFGGGSMIHPFLPLYLKQSGLKFPELSLIYVITPFVQLLGSILLGLIADKVGQSKPILVGTLLAAIAFLFAILFAPDLKSTEIKKLNVNFTCDTQFNILKGRGSCVINESVLTLNSCEQICPEHLPLNLDKGMLAQEINLNNFSLLINVESLCEQGNECIYSMNAVTQTNSLWCDTFQKRYCSLVCHMVTKNNSTLDRSSLLIVISTVLILHLVFESLTYRFLDVTTMCLVKEYDKDFGRERFWANLGIIVFSSLSGYIIKATSSSNEAEPRNYAISIYLYGLLSLVSLFFILTLKVCIYPPGQKMWIKSLTLLKNPDVLSFGVVLVVLGTSWGFNNIYTSWYLEDLHGTSLLLGLVPAISCLSSLPFLLTSNWWVRHVGCTTLFVIALLASMVHSFGLSIIENPWWAIAIDLSSVLHNTLLWVAVIVYSHSLAPDGLRATLMASAGGIHYGLGKGTGGLIGGLTMNAYGGRNAFKIMSCMCLTTAVLYFTYLLIRKKFQAKHLSSNAETIIYSKLEDTSSEEDTEIKTITE